ncbi:unnamed protein product [Brugia timori]|uniref:Transposase n=1 Tax=Brugia timori TaxID=42155 RepID=A0A0R3R2D0_9BILA|nr:unnamed protein product [Brugia timori]
MNDGLLLRCATDYARNKMQNRKAIKTNSNRSFTDNIKECIWAYLPNSS